MPLNDFPLDQLKVYQGCNPKPPDFDEYWDRALQEMRAIQPQVQLVLSDFQTPYAECYHLTFTGVRGARVHAKYLKPKFPIKTPHPAIIKFHGYFGNSGEWTDKLPYVSLGYSVIAMDARGQAGLSEDTGGVKGSTIRGHIVRGLDDHEDNLLFRHIFLDTAQLASIVMDLPEVDPTRVGVFGYSQGGGLTMACAALEPRVKLLAPVYPFLSDYQRVWDMDQGQSAYEEIKSYFKQFDPQHKRHTETFTRLGYIDIQNLAHRIQGEVMMGVALMDSTCPPSTQFAAYNKITAPKQMEIYPDFAHEPLPGLNDKILQFMMKL